MAQKNFLKVDKTMLALVVLLAVFGLAVLLSTSEYNGRVRFGDSAYYLRNNYLPQHWEWELCMR